MEFSTTTFHSPILDIVSINLEAIKSNYLDTSVYYKKQIVSNILHDKSILFFTYDVIYPSEAQEMCRPLRV
jgi:hypothetical protein